MKSVDTNVLARFIVRDDPVQSPLAAAVLARPSFVTDTVLIETAWLLSSRYRMTRQDIADTLADLIRLPSLEVRDAALVAWAIGRFAAGADFADMMHIAGSYDLDGFVSFEHRLAHLAGPDAPVPIEQLR